MVDINELRKKITIKGLDVVADTDILAVLDRLEAAEKERNDFAQRLVQSEQGRRKAVVERDVLRDRLALESQESGALHDAVERACEERDALRTVLTDLLNDLEERAKWNLEESQRVVACGNGVYMRAKAALGETK